MKKNSADISIIQMKYISEEINDDCAKQNNEKIMLMNSERAIEESLYQKLYTCCAPAKISSR